MDNANIQKNANGSYTMECYNCYGEGFNEIGPICFRPAGQCCGGCYESVQCKVCNGDGELEPLDEEMQDAFMMLSSLDNRWNKLNEIVRTTIIQIRNEIAMPYDAHFSSELESLKLELNRIEALNKKIYEDIKNQYYYR